MSYQSERFEVAYELAGKTVKLVVDPHAGIVVGVEDAAGGSLGQATRLDALANLHRVRRKPDQEVSHKASRTGPNLVELAHQQYHDLHDKKEQ